MSVSEKTGNNFPGTSQLSKFYIKRRFADKEVYEKYLSDIETLLEINKPKAQDFEIPEEKKAILNERIETLESKLSEVSSLYSMSDELNYKNAEKEVSELNRILDQYLADIKEEVSDLQYQSAEYYAKKKIIEYYQSNFKSYVDLYTENKKMLLDNGTILILGKDGILYGCGNNENNYLGDGDLSLHKYMTKVNINEKIKDFEIYKKEVYCLTESEKIYISSFSTDGYIEDPDSTGYNYKLIVGHSENNGLLFLASKTIEDEEKPYLIYRGSNYNYTHGEPDEENRYKEIDMNDNDDFTKNIVETKLGERCIVLFEDFKNSYKIGFVGRNITGQFGTNNYDKSEDTWRLAFVSPGVESENYDEEYQIRNGIRFIADNSIFDFDDGTSYALDTAHNLYVTGSNKNGELGINSDEESINKWTKVTEFDKNVQAVYATNKKGALVTLNNSYNFHNQEEKEYRNEKEEENDCELFVTGLNRADDPLYGLPSLGELTLLKTALSGVNLGRFDSLDTEYTISVDQQASIDILLADFASLYARVENLINNYSEQKIKKWTKVYPGESTSFILNEYYIEIEELTTKASDLYSEITTEEETTE